MGKYESYAIEVFRAAFGGRFDTRDVVFSFGPDAGTGEVDGTIDGTIAVEIGVGSPKQIRASVLDLIFHPFPGKLLVLVDTPGHSTERSIRQAATILARAGCSGVVYRLPGSDADPDLDTYRVDLANVVSKYIGETKKNLRTVLAVGEPGHGVLIFNDAGDLCQEL